MLRLPWVSQTEVSAVWAEKRLFSFRVVTPIFTVGSLVSTVILWVRLTAWAQLGSRKPSLAVPPVVPVSRKTKYCPWASTVAKPTSAFTSASVRSRAFPFHSTFTRNSGSSRALLTALALGFRVSFGAVLVVATVTFFSTGT